MSDRRMEDLIELKNLCAMKAALWATQQIEVGDFTYGKPIVHIWDDKTRLKIGKFCSIAGNVHILLGGEHHTDWLTTYPFNVLLAEAYGFEENTAKSKGDVIIGNDVWIGENVTILSGVNIGDGAVIAAGAVVTKNVAPFEIVGGVSAYTLGFRSRRFRYGMLEWWNWPLERLVDAIPILQSDDLDALVEYWRGWKDE